MKKYMLLMLLFLLTGAFSLNSCGPMILISRPEVPPPPWFYPNRIETVRYVYFPDYLIYYDISLRHYIYFEKGYWQITNVLPPRYKTLNLRRSRQVRVRDYFGDNISDYHRDRTSSNRGRRN
jgi:hypothetical protein